MPRPARAKCCVRKLRHAARQACRAGRRRVSVLATARSLDQLLNVAVFNLVRYGTLQI
jgi:hypothetical protein